MDLREFVEQVEFCCPDDGCRLGYSVDRFSCPQCGRVYPVIDDRILNLLPSAPLTAAQLPEGGYRQAYYDLFAQPLVSSSMKAWGAPESVPPAWAEKRMREVCVTDALLKETQQSKPGGLCDFSGGAGYYTLEYACEYPWIIHCDLSVDSIFYTAHQAAARGLENVFFVRMDYFSPPFRNLGTIVCMDTLIRNRTHEKLLVQSIYKTLAVGGTAVFDFHNWWHNPIRRLGLLRENFHDNTSYTRREAEKLLHEAGIDQYTCQPFYQEVPPFSSFERVAKLFLPPTRYIFKVVRPS